MRKSTAMRLVALALLIVVIAAPSYHIYHSNGDSFDFSNTETKVVVSGSMDGKVRSEYDIPTIPLGSMVFIQKPVSDTFYESLSVGDVLTFHYTDPVSKKDMVVTHRIIGVTYTGYDYKYVLAGDAIVDDPSNTSTQTVYSSSGDIVGKVVGVSEPLGSVAVFVSSAAGKAVLIGLFAAIIAVIWAAPAVVRLLSKTEKRCE